MEYRERTREELRYQRRFAVHWLSDIPKLKRELDALGVPYPLRHRSQTKEDYKRELINVLIEYEPRIA